MTSVGVFSYPFPLAVHPPDLDIPDWSQKQLDKHRKEIQSLLGNLFLRITSATIQTRILGVPTRTLAEIHKNEVEGSPNRLLLSALLELPNKFKASMDDLEVSDALAAIIDILRLVRFLFSYSYPSPISTQY
jgi:methionyl-tRNA synthetase